MDKKHPFIDPNREPTEMEDLRKKMETRFQEYKNKYLSDFIVSSQIDPVDYDILVAVLNRTSSSKFKNIYLGTWDIPESEGMLTRGNGKSGMAIKEDLERQLRKAGLLDD